MTNVRIPVHITGLEQADADDNEADREPIAPLDALVPGWPVRLRQVRIRILRPFEITTGHATLANPTAERVEHRILPGEICSVPEKLAHDLISRGFADLVGNADTRVQ